MSSQPIAPEVEPGVERLFSELESKVREYRPKDDLAPLEKAYNFATAHHLTALRAVRLTLLDCQERMASPAPHDRE